MLCFLPEAVELLENNSEITPVSRTVTLPVPCSVKILGLIVVSNHVSFLY